MEYEGRVRLRVRAFPLEVFGGEAAPRDILEQEWWLAALQEAAAEFAPYPADDWPTTTMPAFEGAWCALQQGDEPGLDFDLRLRRAFFGQGRNIGRREVVMEIAGEAGLDVKAFQRLFDGTQPREAVLAEGQVGSEQFSVRGTPTLMTEDGRKLRLPMAFPRLRNRRVVAVAPLPCYGAACLESVRGLFDAVLLR